MPADSEGEMQEKPDPELLDALKASLGQRYAGMKDAHAHRADLDAAVLRAVEGEPPASQPEPADSRRGTTMKQKATDPKSELIAELLEVLKDIRRIARAASVGVTGNERRLARADAVIAKAEAKDPTICQDRPSQEGPREPHEFVTLPGLTTCVRACGQLAAASVHSGGRKPLDGMALALRIRDIEDKFYSDPGQEPCDCTPGETCAFCQGVTDAVARECDSALSSSRVAVRDEALGFTTLREVNVKRCVNGFGHTLDSWSPAEWTNAMCGEAGEAANVAKKMLRHRDGVAGNRGEDKDLALLREKLGRELADVVIYADLVAASQGIDLGAVVVETFNRKSEEIGASERLPK